MCCWAVLVAWAVMLSSCSEQTKQRTLQFFFDGVPEPGATPQQGYPPLGRRGTTTGPADEGRVAAAEQYYPHPPYREGKCSGCHNPVSGELLQRPEDGLCRTCHNNVPGVLRYFHGPVAVDACLFCHHAHSSPWPKMLLNDVTTLCLSCHQQQDLTEGAHHQEIGQTPCTDCHGPHGGDDRFFLKSDER